MLLKTPFTDRIFLPDAPSIPGLTFRLYRDTADFEPLAALTTACMTADAVGEIMTADELQSRCRPTPDFDPQRDILIAEVDDYPVGYVRFWRRQLDDGTWLFPHLGYVRPEWRQRGIGRVLLHYAEAEASDRAADIPGGSCYHQSSAADTEIATHTLLCHAGYDIKRNFFEMVRPHLEDIPDRPLPAGLEVRPVTPDQYRPIMAALNEAFRDHWGHSEATEDDYQRFINNAHFQPHLWQVAWAGDEVAGMVLSYIHHEENAAFGRLRGWPDPIAVRRPWRRQGLASALIARSLRTLKEHGMTEAGLGVDTENLSGALRVYERLGFQAVKRFSSYWKPMSHTSIGRPPAD